MSVILDAHFTQMVLSPDARKILVELHQVVVDQVSSHGNMLVHSHDNTRVCSHGNTGVRTHGITRVRSHGNTRVRSHGYAD